MGHAIRSFANRKVLVLSMTVLLLFGAGLFMLWPAYGDELLQRQLLIGSDLPSAVTNYQLSFNVASSGPVGSIGVQFCSNDPIITDPCTPPSGFDLSNAVLTNQSGMTGFSISSNSTANDLILTRVAAPVSPQPVSYLLNNITNPNTPGAYYVRVLTYGSMDATGSYTDYGGLAFAITNNIVISAVVPPFLLFCEGVTITDYDCSSAAGDYIDFGELSSGRTATAQSQLLIATNAGNGYTLDYTGATMTSGNNVITPLTSNDVSRPGTAQFGLNVVANVSPQVGNNVVGPGTFGEPAANYGSPNSFHFNSGDTIVSAAGADDYRKYTVSYIVNVPKDQPPGVYVSTITYVSLANF